MMNKIERHEAHDELIDMAFEPYYIGEYRFSASDILFNCDPILYQESVRDYEDAIARDDAR